MSAENNTAVPIENRQINGLNAKNIAIGLGLFLSIIGTHFQDRADRERDKNEILGQVKDVKYDQAIASKVWDLRIQAMETRLTVLEQSIEDLKKSKKK